MNKFDKLYTAYKLKEVNRVNVTMGGRPESTAEHTFTVLYLAEYFLNIISEKLNREKVYKLIMYHDLVEIQSGDFFVLDEEKRKNKHEIEMEAAKKLKKELPSELSEEYEKHWLEYENKTSREAIFAHACDALDPVMQAFNQPEAWKKYGFTERMVREKKEPYLKEFPEMMAFFDELITNLHERDVIPK